jgi:putative PIG3 family NAD(P)H quinone oxidoreductase
LVAGGGYAEYCLAPEPQCLPVPKGLSIIEAAAIPETYFTVWDNVFTRGRLQQGEVFLVHGGSSGIGTSAIQLANATGARVFTTARTSEKIEACLKLGAERGINYQEEDFVEVVKELTDGKGVDLILDMIGGDYVARNLDALGKDGRLVLIAVQHGPTAQVPLLPLIMKRLNVTGSALRGRSVREKGMIAEALKENVWPLLENGKVKPVIHATFPLEEASAAQTLMESSTHIGKIVLTIDGT